MVRVCVAVGFGIAGGGDFGDPEIQDLGQAPFRHHDVAGLEVAMHDAGGVRGGDGVGNLDGDGQHLAQGRPARGEFAQRPAFDAFHGDEIDARIVTDFVDRDDVGVVQRARRLRFADQPSAAGGAFQSVGRQNLEGDHAIEARIQRLIDRPHAAGAQLRLDLVVAQAASGIHRLRSGRTAHDVLGIVPHARAQGPGGFSRGRRRATPIRAGGAANAPFFYN
jgi:hypothetical protein